MSPSPPSIAEAVPGAARAATPAGIVGWGLYSASSWTWCIGMFLPIVLVKYLGWPGFLLFAVPNIAGVVAFGYVFDEGACRRLLREHRVAVRIFSTVTVCYQLFFVAWIAGALFPGQGGLAGAVIAVGIWIVGLALAALPDRFWVVLGSACCLASIGLFVAYLSTRGPGLLGDPPAGGLLSGADTFALAPAIIFGFLLCPWLDGSFHRARIRSRSPHTFAVFALGFTPMILFTVAYATGGGLAVDVLVIMQLLMQLTFTTAVHLREAWLGGLDAALDRAEPWPLAALLPVLCVLLGTLPALAGEATYLRFLGCYGLIFPAYALLFMSPLGSARAGLIPLLALGGLLVPCLVAYELAFIDHRTFLVPFAVLGLLVLAVLIGWAARRRSPG